MVRMVSVEAEMETRFVLWKREEEGDEEKVENKGTQLIEKTAY